ncbi:MAG: PAS domain S-box protein [Candidatus Hydrogenedentes bacterium]|nr:PAS domain S-box protein [Candidatus Hydrogenedentota bacterium]NLT60097.1 PAS domain S-box protein [Candidatus Hydrogenedentota bacterium]HNV20800.1 histidine kinase N-terminal 7TM domain-containing protein [Candidatus Hydrogenedentota bacterium]HNZ19048.1 histidine kinase N-terminal 7TM domain-containing protein [Candidatus Hydrogenedentota bacterium]HOH34404.1 histidine kinase N-terminal 7TM domain-containing protein [Candidatus Hydrogenedentota bacterium]
MSGWQFHLFALPLFVTSAIAAVFAAVLWRRRSQYGALTLMVLMIAAGVWTLSEAAELGCQTVEGRYFWSCVRHLGIAVIPFAWIVFAFQFSLGRNRRLPWYFKAFAVIPVVNVTLVWTNGYHHLIWSTLRLDTAPPIVTLAMERGPLYWLLLVYGYVFILAGTIILVRAALRSHRIYRKQTLFLLLGALMPLAANVVFQMRLSPIPHMDLTPLSFGFAALVIGWNFLRYGLLLPPVPVAKDQVIESMKDGVIVFDPGHQILDLNEAARAMLGKNESEILGRPVTDFLAFSQALFDASMHPGKFVDTNVQMDGGATRYLEAGLSPIRSRWGSSVGNVMILRDVTDRRLAELEQRRLFTAIEYAAEDIVITDPQGTIVYVNPAFERVTGYARDEAVGQNPRILKSGVHGPAYYETMWAALIQGKIWHGTLTNRRKDGVHIQEDATISPIFDYSGNLMGYVSVKRDVTQQLALEAQVRQAQKLESLITVAGGIAHDFNNILAIIAGNAEMAMAELTQISGARPYLKEIASAARKAIELSRQMLAYSGRGKAALELIDLNAFITQMAQLIEASVSDTCQLRFNLARRVPLFEGDPSQISQLIMNLAINASEAIDHAGGLITIATGAVFCTREDLAATWLHENQPEGQYVYLEITDTGAGMDKATVSRIFDPFYTTKFTGRGLGLAAVLGIVRGHYGAIRVDSVPGSGSTFRVLFPVKEPVAEPADPDLAAESLDS